MRYPPALLDEIRARLPVSQVVARNVKLKRAGREHVGLSPFKQEKTPSFTVNDQKGFYHCFASGEHGDIFKFLMTTEGLSFPEAVERLAGEAGVPLPKSTPEAIARAEGNDRLREITRLSAAYFQKALQNPIGAKAYDYLKGRGLEEAEFEQFSLGYAPAARDGLKRWLMDKGFSEKELIQSGMLIGGPDIPNSYDRFRDRVMFPIKDIKDRVIAFGGRALDPDQPAKYLNSPETPLFHKGHQLYNAASARKAAYDAGAIIVTEGYMDVIAMARAGFINTVAPLGTALTPEQLNLLWRMAEEPVLCLDGDSAGQKAAFRAVETALPLLKPGHSLRFVFLPDGQDPDDLLASQGAEEMQKLLNAAKPLSEVLWQKEFQGEDWSTPERRAALEDRLLKLANTIADQTVRTHYTREIKSRLWRAFEPKRTSSRQGPKGWSAKPGQKGRNRAARKPEREWRSPASLSLRNSPMVARQNAGNNSQEAIIMTMLVNHPWLLETEDETIAQMQIASSHYQQLQNTILEAHMLHESLSTESLTSYLEQKGLKEILSQTLVSTLHNGPRYARPDAPPKDVRRGWQELMLRHYKIAELKRELEAAEAAMMKDVNEANYQRLNSIKRTLEATENSMNHDEEDETMSEPANLENEAEIENDSF